MRLFYSRLFFHGHNHRLFSSFSCVLFLCLWSFTAEGLEYQDFTLKNGLRVILVKESKAPIVISQVWYRVGSADEVAGKTGLAHLLEHMMFQGTKTVPTGAFNRMVSRQGGESNASTSYDFTNYYIKLASDRLPLALRLEADRMRHLQLREETFRSEKLVVQEERRARTDASPTRRFLEKFRAKAYGSKTGTPHPYSQPVIGWMKDIQNLTLEDLRAWYACYYAPDNAIVVIVGDVTFVDVAKEVRHYFAGLSSLPSSPPPEASPEVAETAPSCTRRQGRTALPAYIPHDREPAQRMVVTDKNATLPLWYAGYPAPTFMTMGQEDVFALDVLATILGGGSSSRLYKRLVIEEALAISADVGYGGYSRGWELFTLSVVPKLSKTENLAPHTEQAGASSQNKQAYETILARIEQSVLHEVAQLAKKPVSKRTLARAKNSMIAGHVFARDSIHRMASDIGLMSANGMDWVPIVEDYPRKIGAVSAADVQRVAARYLKSEHIMIGVLQSW